MPSYSENDSVFCPRDSEDIRRELCHAILRRWSIPAIAFIKKANDFKITDKESAFIVESFGKAF